MSTYLFCDNTDALTGAHRELLKASSIYVDCEALALGMEAGRLSLLTMRDAKRATPPPTIYIFDVYTLGTDPLKPIFDLLSSPSIRKIFYDGRRDASALYHEHGVSIVSVIDLELAEVLSRDGGDAQRLPRLRAYLGGQNVWKDRDSYRSLYVFSSLFQSVQERHLGTKEDWKKGPVDHEKWLERPLTAESLSYAANDIRLMSLLHEHFARTKPFAPKLAAMSRAFIALGTEGPPVQEDDIFRSNALLPMGIIEDMSGKKRRVCQGCRRSLATACFSPSGGGYGRRRSKLDVIRVVETIYRASPIL